MKKLPDRQTETLLKKYHIPYPKRILAKTETKAVKSARLLRFPVVMKISSPDIIHKTEAKCVIVNIKDPNQARAAYRQILKNARRFRRNARIEGIMVYQMIPSGTREVIIGAKQDPQFGPVLMFGLGGIFVEVLKDVSFRIIPLRKRDAREMVREIRGLKILEGVRGHGPIDFEALEDTIMKVSKMVWENKKIQELDINPLFIDEKQVWAADVRILV
jgi:acyl-CoA synthetase (NDP forming)